MNTPMEASRERDSQAAELAMALDRLREQVRQIRSRVEGIAAHVLGRDGPGDVGVPPEGPPGGLLNALERRVTDSLEDTVETLNCVAFMEQEFGLNDVADSRGPDEF